MIIMGCDFQACFQQIAMLDPTRGEVVEDGLEHETVRRALYCFEIWHNPSRIINRQARLEKQPQGKLSLP